MLTLAGVGLAQADRDVEAAVNQWLSLDRVRPFRNRSWPGPASVFLSWPTGYQQWPPPLRLNHMWWPLGASRWACGAFLVSNTEPDFHAQAIHDAAFGTDGTEVNSVKLYMDSPSSLDGTIQESLILSNVYVMQVIPLKRVLPNGPDKPSYRAMNLLIVADQRVFWWDVPTPEFSINEGGSVTWSDIIGQCASALGVSGGIQTSTIPSEYLSPSRALNLTNEPIPPILDGIASNLGMKVVAGYDGLVTMSNFGDGLKAYNQDMENSPWRAGRVIAGDNRFLDNI